MKVIFLLILLLPVFNCAGQNYGPDTHSISAMKALLKQGETDSVRTLIAETFDYWKQQEISAQTVASIKELRDFSNSNNFHEQGLKFGYLYIDQQKKRGETKDLGNAYNALVFGANILDDYKTTHRAVVGAIYYSELHQDTLELIKAYSSSAGLYFLIGETDEAIRRAEYAVALDTEYKKLDLRTQILTRAGSNLSRAKDGKRPKEAIATHKRAMQYALSTVDTISSWYFLGIAYFENNQPDSALHYFDKSTDYAEKVGYKSIILDLQDAFFRGRIFYDNNDIKNALKKFNEAERINQHVSASSEMLYIYKYKADIYEQMNMQDSALIYMKLRMHLSDSLKTENTIHDIALGQVKSRLEFSKKEKEFLNQKNASISQKLEAEKRAGSYMTVIIIIASLLLVALTFIFIQFRKTQRLRRAERERKHKSQLELKNKEISTIKIAGNEKEQRLMELVQQLESQDMKFMNEDEKYAMERNINQISKQLNFNEEKAWEDFKVYYSQINNEFYEKLRAAYPNVTNNDEKILTYLKMNLDTKQISRLLNVKDSSVRMQKYRLRKKMNLPDKAVIRDYLDF